jgi:hypothetical protein
LLLCDFARRKKKKRIWRPAILRGWLQRRQAAKASGRQVRIRRGGQEVDHNFFAALRLCENIKEKK